MRQLKTSLGLDFVLIPIYALLFWRLGLLISRSTVMNVGMWAALLDVWTKWGVWHAATDAAYPAKWIFWPTLLKFACLALVWIMLGNAFLDRTRSRENGRRILRAAMALIALSS